MAVVSDKPTYEDSQIPGWVGVQELYIDSMDVKGALTGMDRWSFKPALVSLMAVAVLALICQLPGMVSFILIPLTLLGFAVTSLTILIVAGYCLAKRCPRRGASAFLILLLPALLWRPTILAADIVHLGLTAGFGVGQLGTAPRLTDDSFVVYDWSVGFAGGPNTFLIHDVTDEIALPMIQHTQPPSSEDGFGEDCAGKVQHLIAHYYVCTI
jgi:hypothetical protein